MLCIGLFLTHFDGIYSVYVTCSNHYPLLQVGTLNCLNWVGGGGGTEWEVQGEDCQGGGGRVGGGKVKGQLSLRPVGTLVVRKRMEKTTAVQIGGTLPKGRCASTPLLSHCPSRITTALHL